MKRSLRGSGGKKSTPSEADLNSGQRQQFEKLKGMAQQYNGKSQEEIFRDLSAAVAKGRADGSLTDEKLSQMAGMVSPMLSGEQKQKLDGLMKMLTNKGK